MILAIDIGNTNIVLGCFDEDNIILRERISTNHTATQLEYASTIKTAFEMYGIDPKGITGAIISSVVPAVTNNVKSAIEKFLGIRTLVIGPGIKTGLSIVIDNPSQLGSDLVVDAVAGLSEYPAPMIIIDMGTATTLSVINSKKEYIGGMIVPGLAISHDALISRTSQLSKIALEKPKKVIGSNTIDCIKSGLLYGNAGMLDGLIERINESLGEKCTVVATGGLSTVVTPLCKNEITVDEDLLLKGLKVIYSKNS